MTLISTQIESLLAGDGNKSFRQKANQRYQTLQELAELDVQCQLHREDGQLDAATTDFLRITRLEKKLKP